MSVSAKERSGAPAWPGAVESSERVWFSSSRECEEADQVQRTVVFGYAQNFDHACEENVLEALVGVFHPVQQRHPHRHQLGRQLRSTRAGSLPAVNDGVSITACSS